MLSKGQHCQLLHWCYRTRLFCIFACFWFFLCVIIHLYSSNDSHERNI